MPRLIVLCLAVLGLAACAAPGDPDDAPPDLGDFRLGHNIVVAPNLVRGPASREATRTEWTASVTKAVEAWLGRYEGSRLYHLGISVDGYVLALPGVPVVAAPKSILILQVTVWDDAGARKLNDKPERFTVIEPLSPDTVVGSGLTLTREEQMQALSRNAARQIRAWLVRQKRRQGWFAHDDPPAPPEETADPEPPAEPPAPPGEKPVPAPAAAPAPPNGEPAPAQADEAAPPDAADPPTVALRWSRQ